MACLLIFLADLSSFGFFIRIAWRSCFFSVGVIGWVFLFFIHVRLFSAFFHSPPCFHSDYGGDYDDNVMVPREWWSFLLKAVRLLLGSRLYDITQGVRARRHHVYRLHVLIDVERIFFFIFSFPFFFFFFCCFLYRIPLVFVSFLYLDWCCSRGSVSCMLLALKRSFFFKQSSTFIFLSKVEMAT